MSDVFTVADDDYYEYKFIVEESRKYFTEATQKIVLDLMNNYSISFEYCNEKMRAMYGDPAFIKSHEGNRTLFYFVDRKVKNVRIRSIRRY